MIYGLIGYWLVALPLGTMLAFGWGRLEPLGVYGYWIGLTAGLTFVAVTVAIRLWRTSHDDGRVLRLAAT